MFTCLRQQSSPMMKTKMEKLGGSPVKPLYESSDDEEEEDRRRKRRSMSDPNIIASLQIRNPKGWFKPTVPQKPAKLCPGSPPLVRSNAFDSNLSDPEPAYAEIGGDDNSDKSPKTNQKYFKKKGKPPPPVKPAKLNGKGDKTKETDKAKSKGGIFSRLRKKSDSVEDTEENKRKDGESITEEDEPEDPVSYATVAKPGKFTNKGNKPKVPPPPRPTAPVPNKPSPPITKPSSPPPPRPSSPPPKPPSPSTKPKLENKTKSEPEYATIMPDNNDEDDKTVESRQLSEDYYDDDDDSDDDEPIADPEDFDDDDFSDSEVEDPIIPSMAELHIKVQPIILPIELENEEKEDFGDEAHKVAHELLVTEKKYVNKLFLVDQIFHFRLDNENRKHNWFDPEVANQMFANIKSIYQFHKDFLLPQMQKRLEDWENTPKIGDIMKTNAPFFKMYLQYVRNFDHAMELLNSWMVKVPEFAELVRSIQKDKACGSLSLPHHMLEPVQRLPRYELLMKEYLKNLPEDSADRKDTEDALISISMAAQCSNEAMSKLAKFKKMLELHTSVDGLKDFIVQGRELLKEGKITKRSARKAESQTRYLFLFNDIILCCSIHVKLVNNAKYHVRARMDLQGMQVANVNEGEGIFRLSSRQRVIEFQSNSDEEKAEWIQAITEAVADYETKCSTIQHIQDDSNCQLGVRAPKWVRDDETSQCMRCAAPFHSIKRRRHHCRACGLVVCHKCSNYRARLPYDDNRLNRVDSVCYNILQKGKQTNKEDNKSADEMDPLDVEESVDAEKADDEEEINYSGHLHQLTDSLGRKQWSKRWVVISNMAIHFNKAKQDINPFLSLPLSCYKVHELTGEEGIERPNSFKIVYKKTCHYLSATSEDEKNEWMEMIQKHRSTSIS